MIAVVSPAKTLDFEPAAADVPSSRPELLKQTGELVKLMQECSPADLKRLMSLSDKLAALNHQRYQDWKRTYNASGAKQAVLAFRGDVYVGLDADAFDAADLAFAQDHLRILSGLYGVLRPLDLIQPYRLEMGTRLANERGNDLYAFWGDRIARALGAALDEQDQRVVVNLASNEYWKAVRAEALDARVVTPVFKDFKNGTYKTISFFAKKARGMFAAFLVRERIERIEDLAAFDAGGYGFERDGSTDDQLIFTRKEPSRAA